MKNTATSKSGAALVIVLGFLAVLTVMIVAYTTQTRMERLSGRAHLSGTQTKHLLNTALTHAMEDIDTYTGTEFFPPFFATNSFGDPARLHRSLNFEMEEQYLPLGNEAIESAYLRALDAAEWETVMDDPTNAIGRVGYVIVNTSGLLDINSVGGFDSSSDRLVERQAGVSPRELHLSSSILPELAGSGAYPFISAANPGGTPRTADESELSAGQALVHNRQNAWHRFESLRDVVMLNSGDVASPDIMDAEPASFITHSFAPSGDGVRSFMGTNLITVLTAEEHIRSNLTGIVSGDVDFIMNQLRDYLDLDTVPEDENGDYTNGSVEPVPMVNELILSCIFDFYPETELDEEGEIVVVSVTITNTYALEIEGWYPFTGYLNLMPHSFSNSTVTAPHLPEELFGDIADWGDHDIEIPQENLTPGSEPFVLTIHRDIHGTEVNSAGSLIQLFEQIGESAVIFEDIFCVNDSLFRIVDHVKDLELPLDDAVTETLMPQIEAIAAELFEGDTPVSTSNRFTCGMAAIDPRLNWDGNGTDYDQWQEVGNNALPASPGGINLAVIDAHATTHDEIGLIHVRNEDRIDTPWEFTYFLYNVEKPWQTIQMLDDYNTDNTRSLLQRLSPFQNGPPQRGRINPYSPHTNVIATAFMNLPVDEFRLGPSRLGSAEATRAAELFMEYIDDYGWPEDAAEYGTNVSVSALNEVISSDNPWELESFFRNTRELFNTREQHFAILLAAQTGTDTDQNGQISDDEVRGTEQAVAYIWRDPQTGRSAIVFYGLSDSLRSSDSAGGWSNILQDFTP
jgi:hypothetical protein